MQHGLQHIGELGRLMTQSSSQEVSALQRSIADWLSRNHLDQDCQFLTNAEWRARAEDLLNDAEFLIVTEGGLWHLLNYANSDPLCEELHDLVASFNFWFEFGHTWSIGFYRESEVAQPTPRGDSYANKLRDPRWKQKASLVRSRAGHRCQDCGASSVQLHAHHCWYRYGLEPWQYPLDAFRCLCEACHTARSEADHRFRTLVSRFSSEETTRVRTALERLLYWYDRAAVMALLDALGPDESKLLKAASDLVQRKTEPGAT